MENMVPDPLASLPVDEEQKEDTVSKRHKEFKDAVNVCKQYRRKLVQNWTVNIDYRRGKPFASQSDEDRIAVPIDWSLTKQKISLLFSQVPEIRVNHPPQTISKEFAPWLHNYEQRINDTGISAGVETAMDELLPDCINAAGIGVAMVSREALTEDKVVPVQDLSIFPPEVAAEIEASGMLPDGTPLETMVIPDVVDSRYRISRISPADFLWPIDYTGSDFNEAPWIGRSGKITWAEAVARFKLQESDKEKYGGGENRNALDKLNNDAEKDQAETYEVSFDEVFYKEQKYDAKARSFAAIHHLIFLGDRSKPVVDEPWKGQQLDEASKQLLGALKYPIQVLTLTYISDDAIPPSDSAIGRPQVNELNKSRTHMMLQREHSRPVRWFDVNRVDPLIQQALMRGTWQHMIPVQGNGQNIIGEIAKAQLPQENYHIDGVIKGDLAEAWQVNQGQVGTDIETKAEVQAVQTNMQTRITRERAKVGKFVCGLYEILGGLVAIYEDPASFGEGFNPIVSRTLSYSILVDATVLLDAGQRYKRLEEFYNFAIKTGWLSPEVILKEMATLVGLDPAIAIVPPQPKPPAEPNVSLRLTGAEDMMNPLLLAFMDKAGLVPDPAMIEKMKYLIQLAMTPLPGTVMPTPAQPGEVGPDGQPVEPDPMSKVPIPIQPMPGADQLPPSNSPPPPALGKAFPDLSAADKVNQRILER